MDLQTWWVWKSWNFIWSWFCFGIHPFFLGFVLRCYNFFEFEKPTKLWDCLHGRGPGVCLTRWDFRHRISQEHQDMFFHWHPPLKDQHLQVSNKQRISIYIYVDFRGSSSSSWQWVFVGDSIHGRWFLLGEFVGMFLFFGGGQGVNKYHLESEKNINAFLHGYHVPYGDFLKWWYPTTMGFPIKMVILGSFGDTTI